jgi:L-rhamnose isomerase
MNEYETARERYAALGVDTDEALEVLGRLSLSLHCWQGDDVTGFEHTGPGLDGGGIQVTGNHPGRARNADELRADLEKAFSLIPGSHRLNLHAMYGEYEVDRDAIRPEHFSTWIDWAEAQGLKLDFNATCFAHPMAEGGFTLSSREEAVRTFWIEHVKRCREIGAHMGKRLKSPAVHNLWIPDGSKDLPADRLIHRDLLVRSLDEIYAADHDGLKDALESKLFGIGSESFVVGSHEFYLGYALARGKMICLDTGHFHPTESVADKISALLPFFKELLLHISRGVRWDSDHVVIVDDALRDLAREVVRAAALSRVHVALDFFDATLNRVGAWVIGARAVQKAFLAALLEPTDRLRAFELQGDLFSRLALLEETKDLPLGAVWEQGCLQGGVPAGEAWISEVRRYEEEVTSKRS